MSFTKTNLRVIEDGTIGALDTPKFWLYMLPSGDDVTDSGYFTADTGLKAGDKVLVLGTTYGLYVISESDGVLSATQMAEAS